jgi:hypothetical protein
MPVLAPLPDWAAHLQEIEARVTDAAQTTQAADDRAQVSGLSQIELKQSPIFTGTW